MSQLLPHRSTYAQHALSMASFEALEKRQLRSGSPWYVYGTEGPDVITLTNAYRGVIVTVNGQTMAKNPLDVSTIIVDAKSGFDVIDATGIGKLPLTLSGGGESDTIT